jgi:hypothetical protein
MSSSSSWPVVVAAVRTLAVVAVLEVSALLKARQVATRLRSLLLLFQQALHTR